MSEDNEETLRMTKNERKNKDPKTLNLVEKSPCFPPFPLKISFPQFRVSFDFPSQVENKLKQ